MAATAASPPPAADAHQHPGPEGAAAAAVDLLAVVGGQKTSILLEPRFCPDQSYILPCGLGGWKPKIIEIGSHFVNFQFHAKRLHRFLRETFGASEPKSQLLGCSTRKVMTFPSKG